jgi:hypothetical protein
MIAQTMAAAAADLVANPRPLLFLDTCDLVNLLQVLTTIPVPELRAVNRLLAALAANPQRCQSVLTYVTAIEFTQKTDPTNPVYVQDSMGKRMPPDEVTYQLELIDAQLRRLAPNGFSGSLAKLSDATEYTIPWASYGRDYHDSRCCDLFPMAGPGAHP